MLDKFETSFSFLTKPSPRAKQPSRMYDQKSEESQKRFLIENQPNISFLSKLSRPSLANNGSQINQNQELLLMKNKL